MKLFQEIQILLSFLGIYNPFSSQNSLEKWKNPFVLFIISQFIIFQLLFFSIEAKNLTEYVNCYFMAASAIFFLFSIETFAWNRFKLFDGLINGFENFTQKR